MQLISITSNSDPTGVIQQGGCWFPVSSGCCEDGKKCIIISDVDISLLINLASLLPCKFVQMLTHSAAREFQPNHFEVDPRILGMDGMGIRD